MDCLGPIGGVQVFGWVSHSVEACPLCALDCAQGAGHAQVPGGVAQTRACPSFSGRQMGMKVTVMIICCHQGVVDLASLGGHCGV